MPKVALDFDYLGGPAFFVALTNTGSGPALDVDLTMTYEPEGPKVHWKSPLLSPGECVRFLGPEGVHYMTALIEKYERLVLAGSCLDALGGVCDVHQTVIVKENWQSAIDAQSVLDESDSLKMTRELEKIRRELESIHTTLERRATHG
jgi:hypothetical protein